eukprot:scaffold16366_cov149-Skeletonema_dohrnii-CCMP3373.AAC.1
MYCVTSAIQRTKPRLKIVSCHTNCHRDTRMSQGTLRDTGDTRVSLGHSNVPRDTRMSLGQSSVPECPFLFCK